MSDKNNWKKSPGKLDTSFLGKSDSSKKITKKQSHSLNDLLISELSNGDNEIQSFKKSIYDNDISNEELFFTFGDNIEIEEDKLEKFDNKKVEKKFEEPVYENDYQTQVPNSFKNKSYNNFHQPKPKNPFDAMREKPDKSIYDDIKELEILYQEFKKHRSEE